LCHVHVILLFTDHGQTVLHVDDEPLSFGATEERNKLLDQLVQLLLLYLQQLDLHIFRPVPVRHLPLVVLLLAAVLNAVHCRCDPLRRTVVVSQVSCLIQSL